jgi:hypothetical protein
MCGVLESQSSTVLDFFGFQAAPPTAGGLAETAIGEGFRTSRADWI